MGVNRDSTTVVVCVLGLLVTPTEREQDQV